MLDPEKVAFLATQDHNGVSLRERIYRCEEMPCYDCQYAESQQSAQQEDYTRKEAPFAIHV